MSKIFAIMAIISSIVGLLADSPNQILNGVIIALAGITWAIADKK